MAYLRAWGLKKKFKATANRQNINRLDWQEFKWLIGAVYRKQNFIVEQTIGHGPDGGVDIELRKNGELWLVQCKHWKTKKVGVKVLRELYGILISRQAQKMIVISSGNYTREAVAFSEGKRFILINGDECVSMIEDIK